MISAIVLAAGESSRMGRLKQLLPWGGTTLLDWQVRQLRAAGVEDVVVVLGHAAETILDSLRETGTDCRPVLNEGYLEGRASSLRRGGEAVEDTTEAVIIVSVDQPSPAWVTRRLVETWRASGAKIVMPHFGSRNGHPLLLNGALLPDLRRVTDEALGLRAIVDANREQISTVDLPDLGMNVNLNTLPDYETALASFERGDWAEPAT